MKIGDFVKSETYGLNCGEIISDYGGGFVLKPLAGQRCSSWTRAGSGEFRFCYSLLSSTIRPKLNDVFDYIRNEIKYIE